jgi:hypothetical protein
LDKEQGLECKDSNAELSLFEIKVWIKISSKLKCLIEKLLGLTGIKNYFRTEYTVDLVRSL